MTDTYPSFRLKPKMNAQKIRHGFPWVYENEVVTDRRTRALAPGTVAVLLDSDQNPLGLFAVNPNSKIFGRALDGDISTTLDVEWFEHKLQTALSLRQRLFDQPYYRLIHAEADGLPGLIIDRFGDVLVVQPNAAWIDRLLPTLSTALQNVLNPTAIMMNGTGRSRALEGLSDERNVIYGALPDQPLPVPMNNATYFADLAEGQKTGLFFDQRPNHAFVQQFAKDARVLDVFCHVGGFGLAAMANGAAHTCFVDGSQAALDLAKMGANATAPNASTQFMKSDAFIALDAMHEQGQKFDVVVCDPPAFAPNKAARGAGLRAYERVAKLAAPLVADGGILALCSCSHAVDLDLLRGACTRGIGRAGRKAQLVYTGAAGADHPQHLALAETGYLKSLVFYMQ